MFLRTCRLQFRQHRQKNSTHSPEKNRNGFSTQISSSKLSSGLCECKFVDHAKKFSISLKSEFFQAVSDNCEKKNKFW